MPFDRATDGIEVTGYTVQTPKFDPDKECAEDDPFPWIKIGTSWLVMIYDMVSDLRIPSQIGEEWIDAHNAKVDDLLSNIEYG